MIVSFFGHSSFYENDGDMEKILNILEKEINGEKVEFFVGGYGKFDTFGLRCALSYKEKHKNSRVIFITPYLNCSKFELLIEKCDGSIYPEIEDTPLKFAITKRNRWVVEKSDLIIAYITHSYGGAYSAVAYAKGRKVKVINLKTEIKDKG